MKGTGHDALCSEISWRFTQYLPLLWKYYQCSPSFIRGIKLKIRKLPCEIIKYATHSCARGRKPPTHGTKIWEERKPQSRSQRRRPNRAHSPPSHRGSPRTSGDLRKVTLSLGFSDHLGYRSSEVLRFHSTNSSSSGIKIFSLNLQTFFYLQQIIHCLLHMPLLSGNC